MDAPPEHHFSNKTYKLTIGDNKAGEPTQLTGVLSNGYDYNITVRGKKQLALLKDGGCVEVSNLGYDVIALIMSMELYNIEIKCGYESDASLQTIAKGAVSFISQKIHSRHDTTTYITYTSTFIAAFSQSRINFNFNSGVNTAAMITYLMNERGAKDMYISPHLKDAVCKYATSLRGTAADCITQALATAGGGYEVMTDNSYTNNVISLTDISEKRVIKLNKDIINIQNGNPTVTSEGLSITVYPVITLVPGDIIQVPMDFIDLSSGTTTPESVQQTFNTSYVDPDGYYIIQNISYTLQNRGEAFEYNISALSVDRYKVLTGVSV